MIVPECASYEANNDGRFRSVGDSPSFMHQISVGLGSLDDPTYGGWGGRFVRVEGSKNVWRDDAKDDGSWSNTIWRWSEAFQNDWAARADWCVKSFEAANHNPTVVVNRNTGKSIVRIQAEPGSTVKLNAKGSSDPDSDSLSYQWWYYKDASTYDDEVRIDNADTEVASFRIPSDLQDNELHLILTVRDIESSAVLEEINP